MRSPQLSRQWARRNGDQLPPPTDALQTRAVAAGGHRPKIAHPNAQQGVRFTLTRHGTRRARSIVAGTPRSREGEQLWRGGPRDDTRARSQRSSTLPKRGASTSVTIDDSANPDKSIHENPIRADTRRNTESKHDPRGMAKSEKSGTEAGRRKKRKTEMGFSACEFGRRCYLAFAVLLFLFTASFVILPILDFAFLLSTIV